MPKVFDLEQGTGLKQVRKTQNSQWKLDAAGEPVTLVTGCLVTKFDKAKMTRTGTKAFFPGNDNYLCNVSLPIALRLAEQGRRVIIQCGTSAQAETIIQLVKKLPCQENIGVLQGDLGRINWLQNLDICLSHMEPVSRVDFLLYESYTADADRPFLPTWEENAEVLAAAINRRVKFFQNISAFAYDLVKRRGQKELRVLGLTALASFRPAAYLFADAAHKAVSSTFLQTWAREAAHYVDAPVGIIELCPGIVDTGLYDPPHVREVAWDKAERGRASFGNKVLTEDLNTWPMISPWQIAEIAEWYLKAEWGQNPYQEISPEIRRLLSAGRDPKEVKTKVRQAAGGHVSPELPLYAYYPGYPWGCMPPLKAGYAPVFITPRGQFV
jgi:NAD(P)-dependent dehydrogenase (short-subunit alcohol dehydrogenase family)